MVCALVLLRGAEAPKVRDVVNMLRVCVQDLPCEEVAVYSISCKSQTNINLVLDWLIAHSKK